MVYGFVKQSGGHVTIDSRVGHGTTVKLLLPRATAASEQETCDADSPAPLGRGETVLVVEDDQTVRLLIVEVLRELGYRYLEAADSRSAIPILQSEERLDLVVSDVGLPGMNGRQLAEVARSYRPGLKVLFVTGYAESAAARGSFLGEGMAMISKPFALQELGAQIRKMLEGGE
jgi:CheY-like chemotaxis protein